VTDTRREGTKCDESNQLVPNSIPIIKNSASHEYLYLRKLRLLRIWCSKRCGPDIV
jgi:hypothetical protein